MQLASPVNSLRHAEWPLRRGASELDLTQRRVSEILRKLQLAAELMRKDDAQRICENVFDDLTSSAEEEPWEDSVNLSYEALAEFFTQSEVEAERLLDVCRRMWGQSHVAAIFSLLLHKWLLEREEAEGKLPRHKYLNVLLTGCRQLFWMDIEYCTLRFPSLFHFIYQAYSTTKQLPFKNSFLPLIGQFLPYYHSKESLLMMVMRLPYEKHATKMRSPWMPSAAVGFTPDVLFMKITEMLKQLRGVEPGLVCYLESLHQLKKCPFLTELRTVTRVQFQAQLYSLTSQGGPWYPSRRVRGAAFSTLDVLYPAGARTRKLISRLFKICHPLDWPRTTATVIERCWSRFLGLVLFLFSWIALCFRCMTKLFLKQERATSSL